MNFDEIWNNDGALSSCSRDDAEDFYNEGVRCQQAKIDELQARVEVYELHIKSLKNIHENDFNEESKSSYILGNLDGFFECIESDLKVARDD